MKRLRDRLDADSRTHEQASKQDPRTIDPHKRGWLTQGGDEPTEKAPGSDDAFPDAKMPEYDFFDR